MDKNEQILEILNKMNTKMDDGFKYVNDKMDDGFKDVNDKIEGLQGEMQEGLKEAYNERQEIKMLVENDITKNINLLVEGQQNLNAKIDEALKLKDEKELLTIRIEILENEITRIKSRLDEIA